MMERSWIPYCGAAPLPGDWLARWNGDPWLLLALGLIALLGLRRDVAPPFWAAMGVLGLLFLSPLCALSSPLFSVRAPHHLLLTAIAAPPFLRALPGFVVPRRAHAWGALLLLLFRFWPGSPV